MLVKLKCKLNLLAKIFAEQQILNHTQLFKELIEQIKVTLSPEIFLNTSSKLLNINFNLGK